MTYKKHLARCFLLFSSIACFCFIATCAADDYWGSFNLKTDQFNQGMFQFCVKGVKSTVPKCYPFRPGTFKTPLKVSRACLVLSRYSAATGVILSLISAFSHQFKGFFTSVFTLCASLVLIATLTIYTIIPSADVMPSFVENTVSQLGIELPDYTFGRSYVFGWIGCFLGLQTSVVGYFVERI